MQLPDSLSTERLVVRPYRVEDGAAYFDLCRKNRDHLLLFEAGNPALAVDSVEDAEGLLRHFAAAWDTRKVFFMGGWERGGGELVVQVVVTIADRDAGEYGVGYFVDEAHEGRGLVTEAARAAIRLAFEHLGATGVTIRCDATNTRSRRVAERCGLHLESIARRLGADLDDTSRECVYRMRRPAFEAAATPGP